MIGLILLNGIFSLLMLHAFHAVHISYGDLIVSRDSITGEATFYKDDWEKATEQWYGHSIQPADLLSCERQYLVAHVRLWAGDFRNPIPYAPVVKEDAGLSITYRFTAPIAAHTTRVIVDSRAIFSEYGDQLNLMTAKVGARTENLMLTNEHPTAVVHL
jgi:hypothetical protein